MGRSLRCFTFLPWGLAQGYSYPVSQCYTVHEAIHPLRIFWALSLCQALSWASGLQPGRCSPVIRREAFLQCKRSPLHRLAHELHLVGHLPFSPCFTFVFYCKSSFNRTICPLRAASEPPISHRTVNGTQQKLNKYLWNEWLDVITTRKTYFLYLNACLNDYTFSVLTTFSWTT